MRINAEFFMSVGNLDQLPPADLPEIAMAGRSNVGKSSLINKLVSKPGMARTSNTPGRTQTLNYYRITPLEDGISPFMLVDMPGYGFAAVNKANHRRWQVLIERYLSTRESLRGIMQLIDLRHPPQPLDLVMAQWLHNHDVPYLIVGNKADKVAKSKVPGLMLNIAETLQVDSRDTVAFSAETGFGKDRIWDWLRETINEE